MPKPPLGRDGSDGQVHREFHTLDLKRLLNNREETLGKLKVWKTQEKSKREQCEFVEVKNLWAA